MQNKSALRTTRTLLGKNPTQQRHKHAYLPVVKGPKVNNNSDLEGELVGANRMETYESNEQLESDLQEVQERQHQTQVFPKVSSQTFQVSDGKNYTSREQAIKATSQNTLSTQNNVFAPKQEQIRLTLPDIKPQHTIEQRISPIQRFLLTKTPNKVELPRKMSHTVEPTVINQKHMQDILSVIQEDDHNYLKPCTTQLKSAKPNVYHSTKSTNATSQIKLERFNPQGKAVQNEYLKQLLQNTSKLSLNQPHYLQHGQYKSGKYLNFDYQPDPEQNRQQYEDFIQSVMSTEHQKQPQIIQVQQDSNSNSTIYTKFKVDTSPHNFKQNQQLVDDSPIFIRNQSEFGGDITPSAQMRLQKGLSNKNFKAHDKQMKETIELPQINVVSVLKQNQAKRIATPVSPDATDRKITKHDLNVKLPLKGIDKDELQPYVPSGRESPLQNQGLKGQLKIFIPKRNVQETNSYDQPEEASARRGSQTSKFLNLQITNQMKQDEAYLGSQLDVELSGIDQRTLFMRDTQIVTPKTGRSLSKLMKNNTLSAQTKHQTGRQITALNNPIKGLALSKFNQQDQARTNAQNQFLLQIPKFTEILSPLSRKTQKLATKRLEEQSEIKETEESAASNYIDKNESVVSFNKSYSSDQNNSEANQVVHEHLSSAKDQVVSPKVKILVKQPQVIKLAQPENQQKNNQKFGLFSPLVQTEPHIPEWGKQTKIVKGTPSRNLSIKQLIQTTAKQSEQQQPMVIQSTSLIKQDDAISSPNLRARKFYQKLLQRNESKANDLSNTIRDRFAENSVVNEIEPWKEEENDLASEDGFIKPVNEFQSDLASPFYKQTNKKEVKASPKHSEDEYDE